MGSIKKTLKGVMGGSKIWVGGSLMNALFDPGRMFINTRKEEAQRKQAEFQRQQYQAQQVAMHEANTLNAARTSDSLAQVETGAGTSVTDTLAGTSARRRRTSTSTSTSLGVV